MRATRGWRSGLPGAHGLAQHYVAQASLHDCHLRFFPVSLPFNPVSDMAIRKKKSFCDTATGPNATRTSLPTGVKIGMMKAANGVELVSLLCLTHRPHRLRPPALFSCS